jgi:hypothetical protein
MRGVEPKSAGSSATEALTIVVALFPDIGPPYSSRVGHRGGYRWDGVSLFRIPGTRTVHLVGPGPLADDMRQALRGGGIPGWHLLELPAQETPLETLEGSLPVETLNALRRHPFSTLEELAATPDVGLLDVSRIGEMRVAEIRRVVPVRPSDPPPPPPATPEIEERRGRVDARILPAPRLRHHVFLDLLIRSDLPLSALDAILTSLNAEPVPPADPLVLLLLETAKAEDLLSHYIKSHQTSPTEPDGEHAVPAR